MKTTTIITAMITCFLLTWSRGSAYDVIVTAAWLYEHLSSVKVLEATYSFTEQKTKVQHITGASLWDLHQCSWPTSTRPRNDPEELCLELYAHSLNIDDETPVVVYDRTNMQDAARIWWTLSMIYSRENVFVLDGGWAEWTRRGLPTSLDRYEQFYCDVRGNWVARYKTDHFRDLAQMTADVRAAQRQIVDTRLPQHYRGDEVEPCPVIVDALTAADVTLCGRMLRGHMLSSVNLPWTSVVDPKSGRFLDRDQLLDVFQTFGVDVDRPLTTTSYVGSAAYLVALAAVHCGATDVAVYPGSWTEWAQLADSSLVVRGKDEMAVEGHCQKQWNSTKNAFMAVTGDLQRKAPDCDDIVQYVPIRKSAKSRKGSSSQQSGSQFMCVNEL